MFENSPKLPTPLLMTKDWHSRKTRNAIFTPSILSFAVGNVSTFRGLDLDPAFGFFFKHWQWKKNTQGFLLEWILQKYYIIYIYIYPWIFSEQRREKVPNEILGIHSVWKSIIAWHDTTPMLGNILEVRWWIQKLCIQFTWCRLSHLWNAAPFQHHEHRKISCSMFVWTICSGILGPDLTSPKHASIGVSQRLS